MSDKVYVAFGAAYASVDDAKADFAALKEIKREGEIRDLTAAICYKNDKGRIVVHETTHAGKVAAGVGIVAGAIIGALFPPAGMAVIASAVGGAAGLGIVAGTIGHLAGGISRKGMRQIVTSMEEAGGEAAIFAVAVDAAATDVDKALSRAAKKAHHELDKGDVDAAAEDLAKGLDKSANILGE